MKKRVLLLILVPFLLFSSFNAPSVQAEKEEHAWQDEIIYFIMIDRWNNGDTSNDYEVDRNDPKAYHGGDFKGIMNRLDYISDMGFTAIWLTPIVKNESGGYHGYWAEDFYDVEEHFGTLEEFKQLVEEAHKRDIKVIVDLVVNHTGYEHEWLNDPEKEDWFNPNRNISDWTNQEQVERGWIYGLPDLNQDNPEVREYLFDMAKWWIEETNIDGYRLDTVKHVPKSFWEEFTKEVKSVKEDFFLIGEVWDTDPRYVAAYEETGIDSFVDFALYNEISRVFSKPNESLGRLETIYAHNSTYFSNPHMLGTFIDNHDVERFTRVALRNEEYPVTRIKLALSYLYTAPGIPIMYYGTEIALDGGEDPDNRRGMTFRADTELIEYISRLAEIRKMHPALTKGTFELLHDDGGYAIFKRQYEDDMAIIAINNTTGTKIGDIPEDIIGENMELRGFLNDELIRSTNGVYKVGLDRDMVEIFNVTEDSGLNYLFLGTMVLIYGGFAALVIFLVRRRKKQSKE